MSKNSYCPAPWHACFIHPDGSLRPCCAYTKTEGYIQNGDTVESVWNDSFAKVRQEMLSGETPKGCQQCIKKEDKGVRSRRDFFIQRFQIYSEQSNLPLANDHSTTNSLEENLLYLDFAISNKCNLRCRFCGPHNSSSWVEDAKKLISNDDGNYWEKLLDFNANTSKVDPMVYLDLIPKLKNLKEIDINGGEPFLTKEARELIVKISESPLARTIRLNITTNGTVIPKELHQALGKIKDVSVTLSIDGTQRMYQYMRGDKFTLESDVEKSVEFFNSINSIHLTFRFTLCALNIFQLNSVYEWHQSIKKRHPKIGDISVGTVMSPSALRVSNLPNSLRTLAAEKLDVGSFPELESIKIMFTKNDTASNDLDSLKKYTKDLDKVRGQSLSDIQPEFEGLV